MATVEKTDVLARAVHDLVEEHGAFGVGQALLAEVPESKRSDFVRLLGAGAYWDTTKRLVEGSLDVAMRAHGFGRVPSEGG